MSPIKNQTTYHFMENDNKEVIESEVEDEEALEPIEEPEEEVTDWKAKAKELEALAKRNAGIAKRNATKAKKALEAKAEPADKKTEPKQEKKGFDYAEKAYLKSSGVESPDFDWLFERAQETGKDLDALLESKYIQAELKERKETRASKDALPSGTKRPAPGSRDSVDYWIAKGELPPLDQVELRRKVVDARYKAEENKSKFTSRPVA